MYSTYVLILEDNRFYVGNTPTGRLTQRLLEHTSPKFPGSKWTTKYKVLRKGPVYNFSTFQESSHKEDALTEEIMKKYGGGNVVGTLADEMRTPLHLRTYVACVR